MAKSAKTLNHFLQSKHVLRSRHRKQVRGHADTIKAYCTYTAQNGFTPWSFFLSFFFFLGGAHFSLFPSLPFPVFFCEVIMITSLKSDIQMKAE